MNAKKILEYYNGDEDNYYYGYSRTQRNLYAKDEASPLNRFATQFSPLEFETIPDFGRKATITFARTDKYPDYIRDVVLHIKLPKLNVAPGSSYTSWTNGIGFAIIENIEWLVDQRVVSSWTGQYLQMKYEMSKSSDSGDKSVGWSYDITDVSGDSIDLYISVPLVASVESALPIRCLWDSLIQISVKFRPFSECVLFDGLVDPLPQSILSSEVQVEYIILPNMESQALLMKTQLQDLPIQQVQLATQNCPAGSFDVSTQFRHPVRELFLTLQDPESILNNDHFNYTKYSTGTELLGAVRLEVDGHELVNRRIGSELSFVLPRTRHLNYPQTGVYSIPFCVNGDSSDFNGSMNFTLTTNQVFHLEINGQTPLLTNIYAVAHNRLLIENGRSVVKFI